MKMNCPTCGSAVTLNSVPVRGNSNDGSDAWVCLKCQAVICVDCYHKHTASAHPEMVKQQKKKK